MQGNLLQSGLAMLDRGLQAAAGVTVTASRVTGDVYREVDIPAVVGRTVFKSEASGRVRIDFGDRDYLVEACRYTLGPAGEVVEPADGDRFVETVNGVELTYELARIPGEPRWRYSDPQRTRLRLHCVRVNTVTANPGQGSSSLFAASSSGGN
jgi:hypothetical protein